MNVKFNSILKYLPEKLSACLKGLDERFKDDVQEIRIRTEKAVCIVLADRNYFLNTNGTISELFGNFVCDKSCVEEIVKKMCGYSVHSKMQQLINGYITLDHGNRAGICGRFVPGKSVTEFSSVIIRVSKEIKGSSLPLLKMLKPRLQKGILIAGTPASGKTTLIRDMARVLSNGEMGEFYQVLLIDERDEIASFCMGTPQNDVGNADVIRGLSKVNAIEIGTRAMSPDLLIMDEIGNQSEAELLKECLNNGISIIATVHLFDETQLFNRKFISDLIYSDVFNTVVFLKKGRSKGVVDHVFYTDEHKNNGMYINSLHINDDGINNVFTLQKKASKP